MKVLFCYDGTEFSERALAFAGTLLQSANLQAVVLYVVPEVNERFRHYEWLHEKELSEIESLFADKGEEFQVVTHARDRLKQQGIEAERKVRSGDPGTEILAEIAAGGYDLVVLGSHSQHSALSEFFMGSVSRTVSERAPVSSLIVRRPVP